MTHKFVIMVNGKLHTYHDYDDIPDEFDHVIEFVPEVTAGPHTNDEHEALHEWNEKLQKLMEKERARSNKTH